VTLDAATGGAVLHATGAANPSYVRGRGAAEPEALPAGGSRELHDGDEIHLLRASCVRGGIRRRRVTQSGLPAPENALDLI
jgi:hypothetical protein